jgi:hypothetical protein
MIPIVAFAGERLIRQDVNLSGVRCDFGKKLSKSASFLAMLGCCTGFRPAISS